MTDVKTDCPSFSTMKKMTFSRALKTIFFQYKLYETIGDGNCFAHAMCVALNNHAKNLHKDANYGVYTRQKINDLIASRITEENWRDLRETYANNSQEDEDLQESIWNSSSPTELANIIASQSYYVEVSDLAPLSKLLDIWIIPINQQYQSRLRYVNKFIKDQICVLQPFYEENQYFWKKVQSGQNVSVILVYVMSLNGYQHYRLIAQNPERGVYRTVFQYSELPVQLRDEIQYKFSFLNDIKIQEKQDDDVIERIKNNLLHTEDVLYLELTDSDEEKKENRKVCTMKGCNNPVQGKFNNYCVQHMDDYISQRLQKRKSKKPNNNLLE